MVIHKTGRSVTSHFSGIFFSFVEMCFSIKSCSQRRKKIPEIEKCLLCFSNRKRNKTVLFVQNFLQNMKQLICSSLFSLCISFEEECTVYFTLSQNYCVEVLLNRTNNVRMTIKKNGNKNRTWQTHVNPNLSTLTIKLGLEKTK